jgi:hypothetical protein
LFEWQEKLTSEFGKANITRFYGSGLTGDLEIFAYPDFGLYIYRSKQLYLAVRCGSIGQKGNGGHAHNDQLGIELSIDGKDIIRDPGTYLYTPLPEKRNLFRSTSVHFVPQIKGKEQNYWLPGHRGLFSLITKSEGECLYFNRDGFVGLHKGSGKKIYRLLLLNDREIEIYDFGSDISHEKASIYSNGYGRIIRDREEITR